MAGPIFKDRVLEYSTTEAADDMDLNGPVVGYQGFEAIGANNSCFYCVAHTALTEWECGLGTYLPGGILRRDAIYASSNGGGKVNFSAGVKECFVTVQARSLVSKSASIAETAVPFGDANNDLTVSADLTFNPTTRIFATHHGAFTGDVAIAGGLALAGSFAHTGPTFGAFSATPVAQQGFTTDIKDVIVRMGFLIDGGATPLDLDGGTAIVGYGIFESVAAPSPSDGHVWNDSTQKSLKGYLAGITQSLVGCLMTQYADVTVSNTTTETTLVSGSIIGSNTLPANFWTVGKTVRVRAEGSYSTAASPGTVRPRIYFGSTSLLSVTFTPTGSVGTCRWVWEGTITCRSLGGSGTVMCQGQLTLFTATSTATLVQQVSTATTTIDTTASATLDVRWKWNTADAANIFICTHISMEVLN